MFGPFGPQDGPQSPVLDAYPDPPGYKTVLSPGYLTRTQALHVARRSTVPGVRHLPKPFGRKAGPQSRARRVPGSFGAQEQR